MKCVICGKEFNPRHNGGKPQIVCSRECLYERKKQYQNQNYQHKKDLEKLAKRRKKLLEEQASRNYKSLDEMQKAAAELGLSYGQYEAMKWMGNKNG